MEWSVHFAVWFIQIPVCEIVRYIKGMLLTIAKTECSQYCAQLIMTTVMTYILMNPVYIFVNTG